MRNILFSITVAILTFGCRGGEESINMDRWLVNGHEIFEEDLLSMNEGDRALFQGETTEFVNFELSGCFRLVDGGQAALMLHTDSTMSRGYELFFGNGVIDSNIKSGSLTGVRNLFRSLAKDGEWSQFSVRVSRRSITVDINENKVVDYIEPNEPFRTKEFAQRVLSSGNFAIICKGSEAEFKGLKVRMIAEDQEAAETRYPNSEDSVIMGLQQRLFPLIDYHVHLKGLSKEQAYDRSLKSGINFGIAPNCGIGFPITNDAQVREYRDSTQNMPFLFGMQGEGREWPTTFSNESRALFDYVFTDALTFDDHRGRRTKLWIDSLVHVDISPELYVDLLVDRSVKVINSEPLDIFVNPTLLPRVIRADYDKYWTEPRMDAIIEALAENGVALEINDRYEIPSIKFLERAKRAGVKFTFGTNNTSADDLRDLEYAIGAAIELGLTKDDMWSPSMKRR
ncbi:MAG: family 16 glycoside hydrolase [Rikenellaceae bacterium]